MKQMLIAALAVWMAVPLWAASFTTAAEVKPILGATKANWVAVREFDGQDLLYFTHLESWRCGLDQIRYFVNQGKPSVWQTEPCYEDTPTPNALKLQDHLPYTVLPLGSIEQVTVEITYDDGTIERETFERASIMTP